MSFMHKPLEQCYSVQLDKWFGKKDCFYEFNPGKFVMPREYENMAQSILDFEVRSDDTWLVSFPRTGSTWCQEITWLIANNLDFEKASCTIQHLRAPTIEIPMYIQCEEFFKLIGYNSIEYINNLPSPRFIKSHLPYDLLPRQLHTVKPKIIYIARNPKDVCVSFYHYLQFFHGLRASFAETAEYFCKGKLPAGSVLEHYQGFWKRKDESNILFLKYEELRSKTKETIKVIANYLEKPLTGDEVDKIYNFLTLSKMKNNPSVNMKLFVSNCERDGKPNRETPFFGKGKIGSWKSEMTLEISKMFDEWIEEELKETNLTFD